MLKLIKDEKKKHLVNIITIVISLLNQSLYCEDNESFVKYMLAVQKFKKIILKLFTVVFCLRLKNSQQFRKNYSTLLVSVIK